MLAILAREGAVSALLVTAVAGAGVIAAIIIAAGISVHWTRVAERLEEAALALEQRRAPTHLARDNQGRLERAERRMLEASEAVAAELETLAEQRDEFEAILRSMTEAVVVTSTRGEVMLVNGAARLMFALGPETDYRGRTFVELCRDPRLQEFVTRAMAAVEGGVVSAEFQIQNPAARYLTANASPVRTSDAGRAAAWVLVFHDLTQLKSYENLRADFIANLTHEIRTPLSALCGYAETLAAGVDDAETERRFLGIIDRQARRLSRLVDDMITLSDLERGLSQIRAEPIEARRLVGEVIELMGEPAERQGVALEAAGAEPNLRVAGDRDRLLQVLINLVDNAIKYTPRGGRVTVTARTGGPMVAPARESRAGVELAVADTGEGIASTDIPRLTERFYRVDRARSRELGGTGLGLAIVKHIVQLHGGYLKIESRLREGTTVTVWLPAGTAPAKAPAA